MLGGDGMIFRKLKTKNKKKSADDSIRIITSEETLRMERFERMRNARLGRKEEILSVIRSIIRRIVYTPLGILFHAISFIAKIVGGISAIGMIAGFWYTYRVFVLLKNGMKLGDIKEIKLALVFLIFPFIAYGISVITEKAWEYFEDNAW